MLLWRVTMRELAAKLDDIDTLLHALQTRLEEAERKGDLNRRPTDCRPIIGRDQELGADDAAAAGRQQ